jgi:hypothetical protein
MNAMISESQEALARFMAWVAVDLILERVMYPTGAFLLKVVTLGRYPRYQTSESERHLISIFPFVVLLVGVTLWYL